METATRYHVGPCPICGDGLRGVRICCDRAVVLCDECDAAWASPALTDRISAQADPECGCCHLSLWGEQAHWASRDELEATGWWPQVVYTPEAEEAAQQHLAGIPASKADEFTKRLSVWIIFALLLTGFSLAALAVL